MGSEGTFSNWFRRMGRSEEASPRSPLASALHPAMQAELLRLDLLRSGLGQKALHYVATGDGAEVLTQIGPLCTGPYQLREAYEKAEPHNLLLSQATSLALITGEIAPGQELRRMVAVRRAKSHSGARHSTQTDPRGAAIMELASMISLGLRQLEANYRVDWSRAIPLETVLAHVRSLGGQMADLFTIVLRCAESDKPENYSASWPASAACRTYLETEPAAFVEAIRRGGLSERTRGLALALHHGVWNAPDIEALIVAMLGKPFAKSDRTIAVNMLTRLDPAQLHGVLERHLAAGDIETRHALVEVAGRAASPDIVALLAARAKVEKAAKVKAAIAAVLEVKAAAEDLAPAADEESGTLRYLAVSGETITCPPHRDLGAETIPAPSDQACIDFVDLVPQIEAIRRQHVEDYNKRYNCTGKNVRTPPPPFTRAAIEAAFATLTQAVPTPRAADDLDHHNAVQALIREVRGSPAGQKWLRAVLQPLSARGRLRILAATGPGDMRAVIGASASYFAHEQFGLTMMREWLGEGLFDLRDVVRMEDLRGLISAGHQNYRIPAEDHTLAAIASLPPDTVWPWLVQSMEVLDEALGLRPAESPIPLSRALGVLALLPATPQRYLPRLVEIAVAEKRALRLQAKALLRGAKDLAPRIEALLDDKRQPVRANAAEWLADIRATASEGALRKRLKKESSDAVRTALIVALQRLGADLADVIGPASLIAEAEKAAAKTPTALPDWLVARGIPPVRFRDGTGVPRAVAEYWMALAIRLKDPGAHGQFGIYLDQLVPEDARALSNWVLESWIAHDTTGPTREEATVHAKARYLGAHAYINGRYVRGAQLPPEDQARLLERLIREKMAELPNSGSDTKGLLALACRADPVWAAGRVRWFLKAHGRRSNQAMALLEALAGTGAPAALQVVIAASARLKQKSTQARAAEIAQRYADDRGWSVDELADRTVPTAGFDEAGELELPCGEDARPYVARLDAALAIHLFNPEGKVVKALPAGDDEHSKESKKAFAAAKKELSQIVAMQGERLFEAMCLERQWPVADWRMAFHEHPVMRRLIERLVWQGLDADGQPLGLFRPTQEGDFTDAADGDVAIDGFAAVRLAHGALVDAATCAAWIAHLKDYEIKPFIAQFDRLRSPLTPEQAEAEAITDRQGWAADSFTFRGAAEKRGYLRVMRDSGGCHEYVKTFRSQGITATIWHTGSYAHDDNNRVALKELKFEKSGHRGAYRLKDVPPVLLAECWADYHAVAAKGAFDPDWEKICPW